MEKLSDNKNFSYIERNEFKEKINYLRNIIFQNRKYMKRYRSDINLISYNNKDIILDTWKSLKKIDDKKNKSNEIKGFENISDDDTENESDVDSEENKSLLKSMKKVKEHFAQLHSAQRPISLCERSHVGQIPDKKQIKPKPIIEINNSDSESDKEDELVEMVNIEIKGKTYILEGNKVYTKNNKGQKDKLYGTYYKGKVKKITKEFDV